MSPMGRRLQRLTILAFLAISLALWRHRMIALKQRAVGQGSYK